MLLSEEISACALECVRLCFLKFVEQFCSLYGENNVSYNVYLLLHLCDFAKVQGNLTRISAFVYEDACEQLLKAFHGTQGFQIQMVKNF